MRLNRFINLLVLLFPMLYCGVASAQMDITTWQVNTSHTGVNPTEQKLNPGFIQGIGNVSCLFAEQVDGQVNAQPLYLTKATTAGLPGTFNDQAVSHNVVYVATQNGTVYAIDSDLTTDSCSGVHTHYLWTKHLVNAPEGPTPNGVPETFNDIGGAADIAPLLALTETPVIDPSTGTLFVVVEVKDTVDTATIPANAPFAQVLYALDVKTGNVKGVLNLTPEFNGDYTQQPCNATPPAVCDLPTPSGPGKIPFFAEHQHLRSALTLDSAHQTIYMAFASHNDQTPYWGLVMGYNISNLKNITLQGEFNTVPVGNTQEGGVWMGGASPALDPLTNQLFVATGNGQWNQLSSGSDSNGPFTTGTDFAMSMLSLSTDPATIVNYRGEPEMRIAFKPADGNFKWFTPSQWNEFNNGDRDLGSGGLLLLPPLSGANGETRNLMIGGGKGGFFYLLDRTNLGGNIPDPNQVSAGIVNTQNNNAVQQIMEPGLTQIFNTPTYFNGNIYYGTGNGVNQRAVAFDPSDGSFISHTEISSTQGSPNRTGGNFISASSPTTNGVVWQVNNGIFAWDARDVTNTIFSSTPGLPDGTNGQCESSHWALPIVDNGKVFFSCFQQPPDNSTNEPGYLFVYGPTPAVAGAPVETVANLTATANSATQITLNWSITLSGGSSDITKYNILRSTGNANNFGSISNNTSFGTTSFVDTNVVPNTTYFYEIQAVNNDGPGATSASASATTFPQFEEQGLIAYWPFDEISSNPTSSTAADVTGHGHTAQKGTTADEDNPDVGLINGSWTFHGTHTLDQLVVADNPDLDFTSTQSFSLTAWVNSSIPGGSGEQPLPNESAIISKSADQGALYGFYINSDGNWAARGPLGDLEGSPAVKSAWTHLALVQDGVKGVRSFYVNGVKQPNTAPAQNANGQGQLWFGDQNATLGGVAAIDGFAGNLDDVRIYNRALSQSDIADLMGVPVLLANSLQPSGSQILPVPLFPSPVPMTEPRMPANQTYTIQVTFAAPVAATPQVVLQGQPGVASVTGNVGNVSLDPTNKILTVQLTGVANAQALDLHISNISTPSGISNAVQDIPFNVFIGDVSQDHKVDSFDSVAIAGNGSLNTIPSQFTNSVTAVNAIFDLNRDGVIDANDAQVITNALSTPWTNPGDTNLAFFKNAVASSTNGGNNSQNAFDNNVNDNWESKQAGGGSSDTGVPGVDPSFIYVNLNAPATVDGFAIQWGGSAALDYTIDACTVTPDSAGNCSAGWQNMVTSTSGMNNTLKSYSDLPPVTAQYFRMNGTVRVNAPFGYQIDEFYVFGSFTQGAPQQPAAPLITSAPSETGIVGTSIAPYIITSNQAGTTFTITGTLPSGVVFDGVSTISGTPTSTGSFPITLTATNRTGQTGSATLTLTINAPAPVITSPLSATATVGTNFPYTISATPAGTTFTITGTLPPGLAFNGVSTISGIPTAAGSFPITFTATNLTGQATTATLTLTINAPAPVITSPLSATATVGTNFPYTISATPAGTTFTITGTLPPGLAFNGISAISGIPTTAGNFPITLIATNPTGQTSTATLMLTINPATVAPPPPPAPPTGVTLTAISSTQVTVSWTASTTPGVTYSIFRSTTPNFTPAAGNQVTGASNLSATTTTFTDSGLTAATQYFYIVEATNSAQIATPSSQASITTPATSAPSPFTEEVAIDAGSSTSVSNSGNTITFLADTNFVTGNGTDTVPNTINTTGVVGAAPAAVYQTASQGAVTYTIPSSFLTAGSGQTYTVVLHFAELFFQKPNQRQFNVSINGVQVLQNFDIVAETGTQTNFTAVVETIPNITPLNGQIVIAFTGGAADQPMINGIEIQTGGAPIPSAPTALTATTVSTSQINLAWTASRSAGVTYNVYRSTTPGFIPTAAATPIANVRGTSFSDTQQLSPGTQYYYDVEAVTSAGVSSPQSQHATNITLAPSNDVIAINAGSPMVVQQFLSDTDFVGGSTNTTNNAINTAGVSSATPSQVYQSARQGNVIYTIPSSVLTPGKNYTVLLHFAELFFNLPAKRVFSISINGRVVTPAGGFDIFSAANNAEFTAVDETYPNITPDPTTNQIVITFTGITDQPMVNGIEIVPQQ